MTPGDLGDVPTLACLNKPQKRALILRDQLRYLDPAHLDTFLHGITKDEPPTYRHVNGAVHPPFVHVTIKEAATRFDLGNVQFPEEGGALFRVHLTVEDERFEMRTEEALPRDDAELGSIAIHRFVAENMFPLFKTKYKAIHARMEKINEARRVAYNMLDHPPAKFEDGETLTRLTGKPKSTDDSSRDTGSRKRKEITKHVSNKRQRVGLESIPDNVKSETFNTIPAQIKVDLFNNIIKTAFPNFDNLITASWNVVSVYANVGSDFPELHKAVVELKGALEEFESAYAPPRSKGSRSRKEVTNDPQNGGDSSRAATPAGESSLTPVPAAHSKLAPAEQSQEGNGGAEQHGQEDEDDSQQLMPPPRILQSSPQNQEHIIKEDERLSEPPVAQRNADIRAHSVPRYTPESLSSNPKSTPTSTPASPNIPHKHQPCERTHKTKERSIGPRSFPSSYEPLQAPGSELMRKRQEYTASLNKANRNSAGAVLDANAQDDEEGKYENDDAGVYEQRRLGSEGVQGASLGNSVLGAKRHMGSAPVAPMLHTRKDGGRASEGSSGGRRGY